MSISSHILNARILVVDDSFANVKLLQHLLTGTGYTSVGDNRRAKRSSCTENILTTPSCSGGHGHLRPALRIAPRYL